MYRLLDDQGRLELLSEVSSGGKGPTHLDILPDGSGMFIAHYVSGTVTFHPLDEQGLFTRQAPLSEHIFTPSHSPLKHHRQEHAHVHQIVLHEEEILVPDLGSNKVWRLKWTGKSFDVVGEISGLEDGDGPRHCVVHPEGESYLIHTRGIWTGAFILCQKMDPPSSLTDSACSQKVTKQNLAPPALQKLFFFLPHAQEDHYFS